MNASAMWAANFVQLSEAPAGETASALQTPRFSDLFR